MLITQKVNSATNVAPGAQRLYLRHGVPLPEEAVGAEPPPDAHALIFATTRLRLSLAVNDLYSRESVRLNLTVQLALTILDLGQFYLDFVRSPQDFSEEQLADNLTGMLMTALRPAVASLSLAELNADPNLRAWLETAVRTGLREIDLEGRSGLHVESLEAYDLCCEVWDEQRQARSARYLKAALAEPALNRPLVDQSVLASLRPPSTFPPPISEPIPAQPGNGKSPSALDTQSLHSMLHNPPSVMRPELWRRALGVAVHTAPVCDDECVYVATRSGQVHAFDLARGDQAWPQPAQLGTTPGDSMLLAAGHLWVPGYDGVLYGLRPAGGAIVYRVVIGGRLSSAPLWADGKLFVSVDVDKDRWEDKVAGSIVAVDPGSGRLLETWKLSTHGLRAQPVLYEHALFVGDRQGTLHRLDMKRNRAEVLPPPRIGRILSPVVVDAQRKQLVAGGSYGVALLDSGGQVRLVERLEGNNAGVAAQPLVVGDTIYVGAADGQVHMLGAKDLKPHQKPFPTGGPIATSPLAVRHLVVVGSNDGLLYALDSGTGRSFWSYRSGHPISVTPALAKGDVLVAVDSQGNVNTLRWCLTQFSEAVRLARASQPPRMEEAIELLILGQMQDEAIEVAEEAGRWDVVARLAADLQLNHKAALAWEHLAKSYSQSEQAAQAWHKAAVQWQLAEEDHAAQECRLKVAVLRNAPLLVLHPVETPALMQGQSSELQVRVHNLSTRNAQHVHLRCNGHGVDYSAPEFGLEGKGERVIKISYAPSHSGSASLEFTLTYADAQGRQQEPVRITVRLAISQRPLVQNNYYGPTVNGDGVIMMRGDHQRSFSLAGGAPAASQGFVVCPHCGKQVQAGLRCDQCGQSL